MPDSSTLQSLQQRVAELEALVARLTGTGSAPPSADDGQTVDNGQTDDNGQTEDGQTVDRRHLLRGFGKAAVGAVVGGGAAVALSAEQAAAANPGVFTGNPAVSATNTSGSNGQALVVYGDLGTAARFYSASTNSAIAVWNTDTGTSVGTSSVASYVGVYGTASPVDPALVAAGAVGVFGLGQYAAKGVVGQSSNGVAAAFNGGAADLLLGAAFRPDTVELRDHTNGHLVGEMVMDHAGELWLCVIAGAVGEVGTWRKVTGLTAAGSFHAITPARVFDSRRPIPNPGKLPGGGNRLVSVADGRNAATGAVSTANVVPAGATAVTFNLTVTATVSSGFLSVMPGGISVSSSSTVNWTTSNTTVANASVVKLNSNREVTVVSGPTSGPTHFVLDVTGYYL
ncbi:MAG: hypothetical protein WCI22_02520 [Actinomycetota bacterium]